MSYYLVEIGGMEDSVLISFVQRKLPEIKQLHNGQGNVIRKLLQGESCLAVIPTGGGKSLLWLLFTSIVASRGSFIKPLCIVLVPYKSLILNHIEASRPWFSKNEIVTSEDDMQTIHSNIHQACVVYTTPEKYVRNSVFKDLLKTQHARVQLVVYDEVHLLQEHSKFRPDMVQCVSDLSRDFSNINRLALTATQEISQTQSLLEVAHMPHDTHIERCSCNRSNCHIEIVPLKDLKMKTKETKFEHDSADMFQRFNKPHRPQTIIFVTSKREAENLANVLQQMCTQETTIQADEITFFHADLDKQERIDRMRGFLEKAITVVVATSAFGTGVNFPNVRLIFHYTIPSNLVEYLQNIGRGGRDGELYECVMYFSYKSVHECGSVWLQGENASSVSTSWARYIEVIRFILSTKCRRAFILPYFDSTYDATISCQQCDNCRLMEVEQTLDIGRIARILLGAIQEFSTPSYGVLFSNVRDIITCGGLPAKRRSEDAKSHPMRGIGTREGYSASNRFIWSLAVTYMLYSDTPLLREEVQLSSKVSMYAMVTRPLMLTEEGRSFLASRESSLVIRYPIELMHLPTSTVLQMVSPVKHDTSMSSTCTRDGCDKPRHTKLYCFKHYQQNYRAQKKVTPAGDARSVSTTLERSDGFLSEEDMRSSSLPIDLESGSQLIKISQSPKIQGGDVIHPTAQRGVGVMLTQSPTSSTQLLADISDRRAIASPATSEDSSDNEVFVENVQGSMEGQFYPGTVERAFQAEPPCNGSTANEFGFESGDPYSTFNSYAKQQCRGMVSAHYSNKRYKCLGVFKCSDPNCKFLYRPRIAAMRLHHHPQVICSNIGLHGQNATYMTHMPCTVMFEYSLDMRTNCTRLNVLNAPHTHAVPPPNKFAPSTLQELETMVKGGSQFSSMRYASSSDDPATWNPRKLQNLHKQLYEDVFGSDLGIGGLQSLDTVTGSKPWVRFAQPCGTTEGAFQMVFCQLAEHNKLCSSVARSYDNLDTDTTAYIYTDVTFAFSDSYAQSFLTDSQITGRGVVIAFSLMTRLTCEAYQSSFYQLLRINPDLWEVRSGKIFLKFTMIVDFADSQRKGFIAAIKQLHDINCKSTQWTTEIEQSYLAHLKGCEFHWLQSVKNTSHNGSVVPHWQRKEFTDGCRAMLTAETMDAFEHATASVLSTAPKCKTWLRWWLNPLHACLIFPSFRTHMLNEDLRKFHTLPTTTNLCESNHRNYYRFLQVKHLPIVVAAFECFKYGRIQK
jgi:RecQ family ATP-dependent DNA helicase